MKSFQDNQGRTWTINLTIGAARRIKSMLGIDMTVPEAMVDSLGKPSNAEGQATLAQRLTSDVMLAVDVLYSLVVAESSLSVDDFCDAIPPAICKVARAALLEEWVGFFRELGRLDQSELVQMTLQLQQELDLQRQKAASTISQAALDQMRREIERETTKMLTSLTCGDSLTTTQESLASTPKD